MFFYKTIAVLAILLLAAESVSASRRRYPRSRHTRRNPSPFAHCSGYARYNVTFYNMLTPRRFRSLIPSTGLLFSPLTVAGHSNRVSILTVRDQASKEVEAIAETGDNAPLIHKLNMMRNAKHGVKGFGAASGPVMPGKSVMVAVNVDCKHPFITGLAMIAPSPDWFVQISNVNMYSRRFRKFRHHRFGYLIAYDAGTDDGREFTPGDRSLDIPTVPQKNIAPLVEDETDRFRGRIVGRYMIKRIN